MKIEIWSDIACPYCYIGKRKMENALDKFPHKNKVEIVWHSYQLDPDMPKKAPDRPFVEYFAGHLDINREKAQQKLDEVTSIAQISGLEYRFDKAIAANTADALRLVKLANVFELANECEEVLFKAYFTDGLDISDHDVLIKLGTQIGLNEKRIVNILNGNSYYEELQKDKEYAENELNLEYIPFYRINGRHVIQGSLSEDDYLNIIEKAYLEWESGKNWGEGDNITGGRSCSIDGVCS